jgi:ring-1,2-phenylacetyl-CoA epoxidase subunit PaaC
VLAQRLGEWIGHGPVLEEDIALANVGLDLLGQGRMWLTYAGEVEGRGRGEDELAFLRDGSAFRNAQLVEMPNGDFAATMARQFYFDHAHLLCCARSANRATRGSRKSRPRPPGSDVSRGTKRGLGDSPGRRHR